MKKIGSKKAWQAERALYSWHLRPPFKDQFDNTHWWNSDEFSQGKSAVDPTAALYELARRHPEVGNLRKRVPHAKQYGEQISRPTLVSPFCHLNCEDLPADVPNALRCLCFIGMDSWPNLTERAKNDWRMSAGSLKGVDCRDDSLLCVSVSEEAIVTLILNRAKALKVKVPAYAPEVFVKRMHKEIIKKPPTANEIEAAIAQNAVAAHRKGHLLISFAPDLKMDKALKLMERNYSKQRKLNRERLDKKGIARARPADWLDIILNFEKEARNVKQNSQLFASYRRILDNIQFNNRPDAQDYILALVKDELRVLRGWFGPVMSKLTFLQV